MTQTMTGGEAVVKSLIKLGVDTIFALPGVQNDWLFNALHDHADQIRVIHTRHEQGAAYMAMGYAATTGKVGVFSVVPGPGVFNTMGALSTAYAINARVLCLTGQIPSDKIGKLTGQLHEVPDQLGVLERITKWAKRGDSVEGIPALMTEAFSQLMSHRPLPVSLEIPPDILSGSGEVDLSIVEPEVRQPDLDLDAIREAAKALGAAKNPMLVVGGGAQHASAEVQALAEALQAPIIPGRSGRGIVSNKHPLSMVGPDGLGLWADTDVAFGIGTRMYMQTMRWGLDDDIKILRCDIDPTEPDKIAPAAVKMISDSKATLQALLEMLPQYNQKRADRTDEYLAHRAKMQETYEELQPQWGFNQAIREALPDDGLFVDEVTQMGFTSLFMLDIYNPRSYVSSGFQGTLGYGFGTALGVKAAHPDKAVVSISGDGGFMYQVQELSTMARHNLNLITIVFADGAFGNVRRMQKENYGGKYIASDLHNPDFVKLAESFGIMAMRATTPAELKQAIIDGIAANAPVLIEVPVEEMPSPWGIRFGSPVRGND